MLLVTRGSFNFIFSYFLNIPILVGPTSMNHPLNPALKGDHSAEKDPWVTPRSNVQLVQVETDKFRRSSANLRGFPMGIAPATSSISFQIFRAIKINCFLGSHISGSPNKSYNCGWFKRMNTIGIYSYGIYMGIIRAMSWGEKIPKTGD